MNSKAIPERRIGRMGEIVIVVFLGVWLSGAAYLAYGHLKRELNGIRQEDTDR